MKSEQFQSFRPKGFIVLAAVIVVLLAASSGRIAYGGAGAVGSAQAGSRVAFGVNPTIFAAGQAASAEFSVSSVSLSAQTVSSGSTFRFLVDTSFGTVTSVTSPISVNSANLLASDFAVSFAANQVVLTYNGSTKPFAYGDTLSVKAGLTANAQTGSGKLSLSSQFVTVVNGALPFTTVSIVDFANSSTSAVAHDASLAGNGTAASPLGIATVAHDMTLTGNGTAGSPLGAVPITHDATLSGNGTAGAPFAVGVPLVLDGNALSLGLSILTVNGNSAANGRATAITATAASGMGSGMVTSFAGDGIRAVGGNMTGLNNGSGRGIQAVSGNASGGATKLEAGFFFGDVGISGNLKVNGMKMFHIDHPLDPENKYLNHAAIESSEVLNAYSGNVITDDGGNAVVKLPEWFEALNKDYRYQLTVVGTFAQAIIGEEIKGNRFVIKTSASNVKVSWQVIGVRSDPVARKFPLTVEEQKSEPERGHYLNPDAYGQPDEKNVEWVHSPELMELLRERRKDAERTGRMTEQKRPKSGAAVQEPAQVETGSDVKERK